MGGFGCGIVMEPPVTSLKHADFSSDMQKSEHELWGGKTTIFGLPPGLAAGTRTPGAEGDYRLMLCGAGRYGLGFARVRESICVSGGERRNSRRHWTVLFPVNP